MKKKIAILIAIFLIFGVSLVSAQEKGLKESFFFGIGKFIERNFGYLLSDEFAKGIGTGAAEAVIYAKIMLFFFLFAMVYFPLRYVTGNKNIAVSISIIIVLISVIMIPARIVSSMFFTYSAIAMLILYAIPVIIALFIYRFIDNFFEGRKTRASYAAKAAAVIVALYFSNEARKTFAVAQQAFLQNLAENNFIYFVIFALGILLIINIAGLISGEEGGGAFGFLRRMFGWGPGWRRERMGVLAPPPRSAAVESAAVEEAERKAEEAETAKVLSAIEETKRFKESIGKILLAEQTISVDELKDLDNLNNQLNKLEQGILEISKGYKIMQQLSATSSKADLDKFDSEIQNSYQDVQAILQKVNEAFKKLTDDINNERIEAVELLNGVNDMITKLAKEVDSLNNLVKIKQEGIARAKKAIETANKTIQETKDPKIKAGAERALASATDRQKKFEAKLSNLQNSLQIAKSLESRIVELKNSVDAFKVSVERTGAFIQSGAKQINNCIASLNLLPPSFESALNALRTAINMIQDAKAETGRREFDKLDGLKNKIDIFKKESELEFNQIRDTIVSMSK